MATPKLSSKLQQLIDSTRQDLRFALRQIVRSPGFSILVVLTLALGIGGSTAIFSVLEGVVLRDLPYPEPERLVAVWEMQGTSRSHQPFSGPDYVDIREQSRTLQEVGALTGQWFNLGGNENPVRVRGAKCTASLFQLLGVQPSQGRMFLEEKGSEENEHVVILSFGLWQGHFGGASDVVGREIPVNGVLHEIVGIMPSDFEFPTPWGGRDTTQLWAPLVLTRDGSARSSHSYGVVGRLADGATASEAEVELTSIAAQLAAAYPDSNTLTSMWIEPMMARTLGSIQRALTLLLIIVGLVLLIACANITCMLLARGAQRASEFAVRRSIGADRRRIVRQLITESLLHSFIGGIAGLALAYWGVGILVAILPKNVPRADGIGIDLTVFGFAVATTLFAGLVSGLAPALLASRTEIAGMLRESLLGRGGSRASHRLLSALVATQIAIGLVLVNAAVLLTVSYSNVLSQELHFDTNEVLVAGISLGGPAYEEPYQRREFYEQLLDRVRNLPGVEQAGLTSKLPLMGGTNGHVLINDEVFDPSFRREGGLVEYSYVDDGYFEAMGIPLLAGRTLTRTDLEEASAAAGHEVSPIELPLVVNRTMAERMWPGEDPIGKLVRPRTSIEYYRARVVGVVGDVMQWSAETPPLPEIYFPHTCEGWGPIWAQLVIRTEGDPTLLAPALRTVVRDIDPQVPVAQPVTMADILQRRTGARRFSTVLIGLFAATALVLIVAGTYGVTSYTISQRTHEIGVRVALGADTVRVFFHFLGRAARLFSPGLILGLFGTIAASAATRNIVFGVSTLNPLYVTISVVAMILVTCAAVAAPVLRATRINPVEALNLE